MMQMIPVEAQDMAFWISKMYAKQGYLSLIED
jgi:hypothetical protein